VKCRLDKLIVERGLADTRQKAQAMIMAGDIMIDQIVSTKSSAMVPEDANIILREKPLYASRGGIKLAHALGEFCCNIESTIAMDVGASTGGFTDCLLKGGAIKVYAIDVGYGQLDYRLRSDSRVIPMERVNARYPFNISEQVDLIAIDVSFISLKKILPNVSRFLKPEGYIICLLKPQFEAGKELVGRRGIISDPDIHAKVLGDFIVWNIEHNFRIRGMTPSPILGASGNREFFVMLTLSK